MKFQKSIAIGLFTVSLFTVACRKDHLHEALEGKWTYDQKREYFVNGIRNSTSNVEKGTLTFNANGTGTKEFDNSRENLKWWANNINLKIEREVVIPSGNFWATFGEFDVADPSADEHSLKWSDSFESIDSRKNVVIEMLDKVVFSINNEYWISYFVGSQMFDKKFIFLAGSISDQFLTYIPELDLDGVLHQ